MAVEPGRKVRFADLDEVTRRSARIVVVHDRREPHQAGALWVLSLTDIVGRPIARERVHVADGDPLALLPVAMHYLYTVGMRVVSDWTTSCEPHQTRHYARIDGSPSMS